MAIPAAFDRTGVLLSASGVLVLSAAAAAFAGMGETLLLTMQYGPMCGGHPLTAPHCAACYVALVLLAGAIPPGVAAWRRLGGG